MPRPKKPSVATWKSHKHTFGSCTGCTLSETRSRVVLLRGSLPCDVLFVGEAPGQAEDTLGKPFIGPAGKLLDSLVLEALEDSGASLRLAYTNLIGCVPIDPENRNKVVEPPREAVKACTPRLKDLVKLARPRALVMVGKASQKWCPKIIDWDFEHSIDIVHPAAILRADMSQRTMASQVCCVVLRDLFLSLAD